MEGQPALVAQEEVGLQDGVVEGQEPAQDEPVPFRGHLLLQALEDLLLYGDRVEVAPEGVQARLEVVVEVGDQGVVLDHDPRDPLVGEGVLGHVQPQRLQDPAGLRLVAQGVVQRGVLVGHQGEELVGEGGRGDGVERLVRRPDLLVEQAGDGVHREHDHRQQVAREVLDGGRVHAVEIEGVDALAVAEDLAVLAVGVHVVLVEQVGEVGQEVLGVVGVEADHHPRLVRLGLLGDGDEGDGARAHGLPGLPVAVDRLRGGLLEEHPVRVLREGPLAHLGVHGAEGGAGDDVQPQVELAGFLPRDVALEAELGVAALDALLDLLGAGRLLLHDVDGLVLVLVHQLDAHSLAAEAGDQLGGADGDQVPADLLDGGVLEVVGIDPQVVEEPVDHLPGVLVGHVAGFQDELFQPRDVFGGKLLAAKLVFLVFHGVHLADYGKNGEEKYENRICNVQAAV